MRSCQCCVPHENSYYAGRQGFRALQDAATLSSSAKAPDLESELECKAAQESVRGPAVSEQVQPAQASLLAGKQSEEAREQPAFGAWVKEDPKPQAHAIEEIRRSLSTDLLRHGMRARF